MELPILRKNFETNGQFVKRLVVRYTLPGYIVNLKLFGVCKRGILNTNYMLVEKFVRSPGAKATVIARHFSNEKHRLKHRQSISAGCKVFAIRKTEKFIQSILKEKLNLKRLVF